MISADFRDRANAKEWAAIFAVMRTRSRKDQTACYYAYINSAAWKYRRRMEIVKAGCMCVECQMPERLGIPLQVHHLSYDNLGDELPGDLVVLCKLCHEERHGKGGCSIVNAIAAVENSAKASMREHNKRVRGHYEQDHDPDVIANRRKCQ